MEKQFFASVVAGENIIVGLAPGYKNPGMNFAKKYASP
jgi:hypothetical protein